MIAGPSVSATYNSASHFTSLCVHGNNIVPYCTIRSPLYTVNTVQHIHLGYLFFEFFNFIFAACALFFSGVDNFILENVDLIRQFRYSCVDCSDVVF